MHTLSLLVMAGTVAIATPAATQSTPGQASTPQTPVTLDEIIVTARRRSENLQDVPASIGVFDAESLDQRGVESLDDLAQSTAGLAIETSTGISTVYIRGVGGGGRNVGFGTRAGIYVDGVYVGQFASINQSTSDVSRVEILRGPQGTLFGRNSVSGAVNVVSVRPNYVFAGDGSIEIGENGTREARAAVNLPLVGEQLALRVSGAVRERDGFTTNLVDGQDLGNIDRRTLRGALLWDINPDLSLTLAADHTTDDGRRLVGEDDTNLTGTGASANPGAFDVAFSTTPVWESEFYGASATLEYQMSAGQTLTAISALRRLDWGRMNDLDYSPLELLSTDFEDRFEQVSHELRFASEGSGRLRYLAGLYFLEDTAQTRRAVRFGRQIGALPLGLSPGTAVTIAAEVETRSIAAFGNLDFAISEALTLNAGVRVTDEDVSLVDYALDGSVAPALRIATVPSLEGRVSASRVDPTLALTYALGETTNVYARYSQGFKSGGFNVDFLNATQINEGLEFSAEAARSYELGYKSELFNSRARINVAVYQTDFEDYQINQFVDLGGGQTVVQLRNAAEVRIRGAEVETVAEPMANLQLGANLAYLDAAFEAFPNGDGSGVDLSGARLPQAPRFTGSFFVDYVQALPWAGLRLKGFAEYNVRGESFAGPENLTRQALDGRRLLNLRVGLTPDDARWTIEAWVRNALDDDYTVNRDRDFFGTLIRERGDPRTAGLTLRAEW